MIHQHWQRIRDTVADGFGASAERPEALLAAVALPLDFHTWRTFVRRQVLDQNSPSTHLGE